MRIKGGVAPGADPAGKAEVMVIDLVQEQADCLRARLFEAADDELAEYGSLTGRFEAVARRAGVSRATAYRQMGSVSELMTQVAVRRAQSYFATHARDRSVRAVSQRFRLFIEPAIAPRATAASRVGQIRQ